MGITPFLPLGSPNSTTVMAALAIAAAVVLMVVLVVRIVVRIFEKRPARGEYAFLGTTLGLGIGFVVLAATGTLGLANWGNVIAILFTLVLSAMSVIVMIKMFGGAGRFFTSRLWLAMLALVAVALYVASFCYTLTVMANSGGSISSTSWWSMYLVILKVIDGISIFLVVYAAIALFILGIVKVVQKIKN